MQRQYDVLAGRHKVRYQRRVSAVLLLLLHGKAREFVLRALPVRGAHQIIAGIPYNWFEVRSWFRTLKPIFLASLAASSSHGPGLSARYLINEFHVIGYDAVIGRIGWFRWR